MKRILSSLRNFLFPKSPLNIKIEAITVPEALDFTEPNFDLMVNEMVNLIGEENRLLDFKNYVESPAFLKYKINFRNSNHLMLLGYAFAAVVFIKRHMQQVHAANKLLEEMAVKPNPYLKES